MPFKGNPRVVDDLVVLSTAHASKKNNQSRHLTRYRKANCCEG